MPHRVFSLALLLACTGCGCVVSVEPLSDDSNSVVDERLFGQWRGKPQDNRTCTFTIRRKPESKATLEIISDCADDNGHRHVERTIAFATRRHDDWLSLRIEEERKPPVYALARYDFVGDDRLEVYLLDPNVISHAVEHDNLRGDVNYYVVPEPSEPPTDPSAKPAQAEPAEKRIPSVVLTDTHERILEYVRSNGDQAFLPDPLVLRRIASAHRPPAADAAASNEASGLTSAGAAFIMLAALLLVVALGVRSYRKRAVSR